MLVANWSSNSVFRTHKQILSKTTSGTGCVRYLQVFVSHCAVFCNFSSNVICVHHSRRREIFRQTEFWFTGASVVVIRKICPPPPPKGTLVISSNLELAVPRRTMWSLVSGELTLLKPSRVFEHIAGGGASLQSLSTLCQIKSAAKQRDQRVKNRTENWSRCRRNGFDSDV